MTLREGGKCAFNYFIVVIQTCHLCFNGDYMCVWVSKFGVHVACGFSSSAHYSSSERLLCFCQTSSLLTFALVAGLRKPEARWCFAIPPRSYREIIRGRVWFISLWREPYLSSPSGRSSSTSKGGAGRLIHDQEQETGITAPSTTVITVHFVAEPLPLDTGSGRWMVIVSRVRKIMCPDSERIWPLNLAVEINSS